MYTLYTDKKEDFKCNIDVEGASISETHARLVLEGEKLNILYEGKVDSSGNCSVNIDKLKNVLKEGEEGIMRLEVIVEDTFFSPWEDEFIVKTNKRVTVEVQNNNKPPLKENRIKVKVKSPKKSNPHTETFVKLLEKKGINSSNLNENTEIINKLMGRYVEKFKVEKPTDLLIEVLNQIS